MTSIFRLIQHVHPPSWLKLLRILGKCESRKRRWGAGLGKEGRRIKKVEVRKCLAVRRRKGCVRVCERERRRGESVAGGGGGVKEPRENRKWSREGMQERKNWVSLNWHENSLQYLRY